MNIFTDCKLLILTAMFLCAAALPLSAQSRDSTVSQNFKQNFSTDFLKLESPRFSAFPRQTVGPAFVAAIATAPLVKDSECAINSGDLKFIKRDLVNQTSWKYVRPNAKVRLKKYLNRSFGVFALIGAGAGAAIGQINDSPEEWENNAKGFARRFASNYAENVIQESVIYGLDETFRVDSQFYKKGKGESFKTRLANALLSGVTARTKSGKRVPGFSRVVGTYAGSIMAAETWYPKRYNYQDGLREGTYSLGFNIGLNILREFILPSK